MKISLKEANMIVNTAVVEEEEGPLIPWAAKYVNQAGSPEQPKEKTVRIGLFSSHKSAHAFARGLPPPFLDGVLERVEPAF